MATAQATTDHDEIREWVESRGGHPARVKSTGNRKDPGVLRIDFPGYSGEDTLEEIEWDEFFEWFDRDKLALLLSDGKENRFNKFVSRGTAKSSKSSASKSSASKSSSRRVVKSSSRKAAASSKKAATSKTTTKKASASTKKASSRKAPSTTRRLVGSKTPKKASSRKAPSTTRRLVGSKTPKKASSRKAPSTTRRLVGSKTRQATSKKTTKKASPSTKKASSRKATSSTRRLVGSSTRKRASASTTTTDHDEIRTWVEARGGFPAHVRQTGRKRGDLGVLRIDYPGYSGKDTLERIDWEDWFAAFDRNKLAFLYQDKRNSRFSKLVNR